MPSTITQRRTRARRLYTGEPHASALNEVRRTRKVLPTAVTSAQQNLEALVLAALVAEFGAHRPGDLEGPLALRWVGPREDSLLLAIAKAHRDRVLRRLLGHVEAGGPDVPELEQIGREGQYLVLGRRTVGGTLLLPKDHGPALRLVQEDLAARQDGADGERVRPSWSDSPDGRATASTVLRRIHLFAGDDLVDFRHALPGDDVLAGPYPELLAPAGRPRVLAVGNSKGGHGCSSLAASLAEVLGRQGHRVLYLQTSRGPQGGPGLQGHRWPEADPGLDTVAKDPALHVQQLPHLAHSFVRCSTPGPDGPGQARQLALLLRHPDIDAAFSHVVIDASPTGLPHAATRTADLTLVPWRHVLRPPGRDVTEVHLTPLGEAWVWLADGYRKAQQLPLLEDYEAYEERLAQFTRERGADDADHPLEDVIDRRLFLSDTQDTGAERWGSRWAAARAGWIKHLLREQDSDTGWDDAAGARVRRTLSDQEWATVLQAQVARTTGELLRDLPGPTGRRQPLLVPTTRMPADAVQTVRAACAAQGLQVSSTVLPDIGDAGRPDSRARWADAVRQLADEACAALPR